MDLLFLALWFLGSGACIFRTPDLFMVEVIYDYWMPRLCPAIGQLVIRIGAAVPKGQIHGLPFQRLEVTSVLPVINGMVERQQMGILFSNVVQNDLLKPAPQVQIFQPHQIALMADPLKDC